MGKKTVVGIYIVAQQIDVDRIRPRGKHYLAEIIRQPTAVKGQIWHAAPPALELNLRFLGKWATMDLVRPLWNC